MPSPPSRSARRLAQRRRTRRRAAFTAVVAVVVLVAVAAGAYLLTRKDEPRVASPASQPTSTRVTTTTTTTVPPPTVPPRDPVRGNGQPVTFAFGGDVHFDGHLRAKLLADPNTVFAPIAPTLATADLAMVNLETAITDGGTAANKQYVFRAPATAFDALRAGGVDVVTMANNHGLDYGPVGLADTLAAKQAKLFPVVGIGANAAEAYAPFRVEVKGQRIAIIGATDVLDGELIDAWTATDAQGGLASAKDVPRLVAAVKLARADADTVVVYLHWGVEAMTCPTPRQRELAQVLTAAGADIVVGSHAHRIQGGGRLGPAAVDYGLGNFVFYNEAGETARTGVFEVTATGHAIDSYRFIPARVRDGVATPSPPGPEADDALLFWDNLRSCTDLAP